LFRRSPGPGDAGTQGDRPLANSYWVVPGQFLAGEYPGAEPHEAAVERIAALTAAGIDCFIDLTEAGEREPYHNMLPAGVEHHRLPLRDHGVPRDDAEMARILATLGDALGRGRKVYVHCRAGIGRTGMVVGCHLVGNDSDGRSAIEELNRLWRQCARSKEWREVPETDAQRAFVERWSNAGKAALASAAVDVGPPDDPLLEDGTLAAAARLRDRFHGALLGLACGDALAAPTQLARRGSFTPVGDLLGGGPYDLPRGAWTDDTAMALCLAESLVEIGRFDVRDQVARYLRWQKEGHLSATGQCLGISANVARALATAQWRRQAFPGSHDPKQLDADPLPRVAVAAMFYFADRTAAIHNAAESARVTCQAPDLLAACRLLGAMLHSALSGAPRPQVLAPALADWSRVPAQGRLADLAEGRYAAKVAEALKPAGDALDLLEAALWCFQRATSFRGAVLQAANLGGNSDTIAAVCGALAGAHFGIAALPAAWRAGLARRERIGELADGLLAAAMVQLGDVT
jgi:ADP-ribosyl-[dinitrogen reductase] hydrolase